MLPFALDRGYQCGGGAAHRWPACRAFTPGSSSPALSIRIDDLRPGTVTGWSAYPAGVAWALREAGYRLTGASLVVDSDLPQGAGLASSAALECAVALALSWVDGLVIGRGELAELARRAESDFVGMPCGIMDQAASLLCEAGSALLLDCRTGASTQVPLDLAAASLMIIDTQVRHVLADGAYAARRQECADAARALGVASLRDVADTSILSGLTDVSRRRARHVVTENRRVQACAAALRAGDVAAIGPLLTESHRSLRDDFEVSWPAADVTVASALAAGAPGARMMGGGFGGSVIALVLRADVPSVRAAVGEAFAARGWPLPHFTSAVPGGGARRVD